MLFLGGARQTILFNIQNCVADGARFGIRVYDAECRKMLNFIRNIHNVYLEILFVPVYMM